MKSSRMAPIILAFLMALSVPAHALDKKIIEISVRSGDYLIDICDSYLKDSVRWRDIAALNRLKDPNLLYPGEKLKIPLDFFRGAPTNGTVTFVKGEVLILKEPGRDWRPVRQSDPIDAGTSIKTGDDSAVEISYDNGIAIFLRSNTELKLIITRKIDPAHILFQYLLDIGKSIIRIQESMGRGSRFSVETPSAIAGARGTGFRLSSDFNELTRCEVLEGIVLIQGHRRELEVTAGEGTVVGPGEVPQNPVSLLRPPEPVKLLDLYRSMPFEMTFTEVENAAMYVIMLARDRDFRDIVKTYAIEPSEKLSEIGLSDGRYYLKTAARDDQGLEGPWSEAYLVMVRVNPLPPFTQFPENGAEVRAKDVQLKWLKVTDAAKYHAQVAEDKDFTVLLADDRDLKDLTLELKNLAPKEYFFRIKSIAADGYQGVWSDVISFRVMPPPPAPPLEKPGVGKEDISIRWRDLGKDVRYHFQVARDEQFKDVMADQVLDKPETTIPRPEDSGVYYVRTSAIDATGYEGDYSTPQTFEVKTPFPFTNVGIFLGSVLLMLLIL